MTDPREFDRMEMDQKMGSPNPYGLIAAVTFIFIILALIFTSNESNRSASTDLSASRITTNAELRTPPPAISVPPDGSASTSGGRQ
jgi:hypothetical protein